MKIGNPQNLFNNGIMPTETAGHTSAGQIQGLDANGNVPLVSEQGENIEQTLADITAQKKGYEKTGNQNIYRQKKWDGYIYFVWNSKKQKFEKNTNIKCVHGNGFTEQMYNEKRYIYDTNGNQVGLASDIEAKAKLKGYIKPPEDWTGQKHCKELFYNPADKKYYLWVDKYNKFVKTDWEVAGTDLIKGKDSYFRATESGLKKISETFYYGKIYGFYEDSKKEGLFWSKNKDDMKSYIFDKESKTFVSPSQQVRNGMITEKADGVINNFTQGNTGDCYLLAAIQAMRPIIMEKTTDKNGNTVEKIKSEYLEIDPETGDITVKLKGPDLEYVITDKEINEALSELNPKYSYGEKEIVAIEMAVEKFFKEALLDKHVGHTCFTARGSSFPTDDILRGGLSSTAMQLLTGYRATSLRNEEISAQTIEKLLKTNNYVCASLNEKYTKSSENHGVVVVGIDNENIYINDSNENTDEAKSIPIPDFLNMCFNLTYTDGKTKIDKKILTHFRKKFGV